MRKLLNEELGRPDINQYKAIPKVPLIIVLDNVRSMNNIGSVFRTSDAFLVNSIYLCGITAQPPHKDIHKTALGATGSVEWEYFKDTKEAIRRLKGNGYIVICIEQTERSVSLDKFKPEVNKKYAIVFGHEVRGVQQEVVDLCDLSIEVPQYGTKHSLNISVCAGVVIWDFFKNLR